MAKELEFKYEPRDPAQLQAVLSSPMVGEYLISDWDELTMETSYYDTPAGDLSGQRWTLRYRNEGGTGVACLKTPSENPDARNEYEVRAEAMGEAAIRDLIAAGAPDELEKLAVPGAVGKICGAQFVRRVADIRLPDGTTAHISGDVGTLFGGERTQPLCEIELELAEGNETMLKGFCALLAREYDLQLQSKSKFARARALTKA